MTATRSRLPIHGASLASLPTLRRPWRARIYVRGKQLHLGYYETPELAREAYADAVKERLGETYLKAEARS
jgi:hypothetical protein